MGGLAPPRMVPARPTSPAGASSVLVPNQDVQSPGTGANGPAPQVVPGPLLLPTNQASLAQEVQQPTAPAALQPPNQGLHYPDACTPFEQGLCNLVYNLQQQQKIIMAQFTQLQVQLSQCIQALTQLQRPNMHTPQVPNHEY